ncbi:hypothetical protein [Vibrio harveyi]|uniref:hypothetical protein n=1 Tax=Vibrio harveyi TaxID=669 RepID=UPI002DD7432E|nr:hypothetical protein [Vibrio vulnificus]EIU7550601.1 hypothetical protein [Vibrio vulnificus]EME0907943.1 hypothetical protein [Vibrio vulnificus]
MNKYQATLFANESDIYTALHSNKSKMAEGTLRKIAFDRGLIFPKKLEREDLVEKISDLPFSYSHVEKIQKKLASNSSQELFSVKRIFNNVKGFEDFNIDELYDVLEIVKQERPPMLGSESIDHYAAPGMYVISIEYTEFDFKRSKFQQRKMYGGEIRFIVHADYISVRFTYTKRIKEILGKVIDKYQEKQKCSLCIREIDLSDIKDAMLRNAFAENMYDFDLRYTSKSGFIYSGLEKVRVSKISTILDQASDIDLDDDSGEERDDFEKDAHADDKDNKTFIDNASYDGKSLVKTTQIEDLCQDGFYRSQIKWKSKATFLTGAPVVTFELAFDEKYRAQDLKFKIISKETAGMPETREKLTDSDFDQVMSRLEEHIFMVNDIIQSDHVKQFQSTTPEPDEQEAS